MKIILSLLIIVSISACATPSQIYWDQKVKEMCEKDGGVTVYEHIELSQEEYRNNGGYKGSIIVPTETSSVANKYDYLKTQTATLIHKSNPEVSRFEFQVYRKSDRKVLGKMVTYSRSGGDITTGVSAESHFACADIKDFSLDVERQIFSVKQR